MTQPAPTDTVHATCIAIGGRGVLLCGQSGSGKSDLALRLLDRGAALVSDDYTILRSDGGRLLATAPATIAGKIEVRGIGIVDIAERVPEAPVALCVMLGEPVERLPDEAARPRLFAGIAIPSVSLPGLEASAPLKVELALRVHGNTIE